jgi:DNA modification methylase
MEKSNLKIEYVALSSLRHPEKNPRRWTKEATAQLTESIKQYGVVDPLVVNNAAGREGVILGGNFRAEVLKDMGHKVVPVVHVTIADPAKEAELIIRLNHNTGDWDLNLLAEFDPSLLFSIGFSSEEMDKIFPADEHPEVFDLEKELKKLDITNVDIKHGDKFAFGDSFVQCGDSMSADDMLALMGAEKADMVCTDPPYILDYLKGKKKTDGKVTEGFGLKRDRIYLGTTSLPDNFSDLWMAAVAAVQKPDFSILIFEHPKNLKTIWTALDKHWKYRNTITWHVPNRVQGFAAKYKFFNKQDIALVGTGGNVSLNLEPEEALFQSEYENALYATSGKPQFESYEKGKKICPTDFIEHIAADAKSSGQSIIFGTKPIELLQPYIKVLTRRGDIVLEPFGGSGSSAVAAWKLGRRFFLMEKSPIYTAVILKRLERVTRAQAQKSMRGARAKSLLIEELKKKPVVEAACMKVGIGRTAFYEWRKKDAKFAQAIDLALQFGRDFVSDIAEMQLLNAIKAGDSRSVVLWLKTHRKEYGNRVEIEGGIKLIEELSPEKKAAIQKAFALANLSLTQKL